MDDGCMRKCEEGCRTFSKKKEEERENGKSGGGGRDAEEESGRVGGMGGDEGWGSGGRSTGGRGKKGGDATGKVKATATVTVAGGGGGWPLALCGVLWVACVGLAAWLEPGMRVAVSREASPGVFSAERAMGHVHALCALGPRWTGSLANEVEAPAYLVGEVQRIVEARDLARVEARDRGEGGRGDGEKEEEEEEGALPPRPEIEVEVEHASGTFAMDFLHHPLHAMYTDVVSVVVRVRGAGPEPGAILLNAHFDSAGNSPGASDDLAGVSVMLELLSILAHSPPLAQDVVMLFNGAEEAFMVAAHGFVKDSPHFRDARVVVNLESIGASGRALLFQLSPYRAEWMAAVYAMAAPVPHAMVVAQDVFALGLITSDDDFGMFVTPETRLPGLDLALYEGGHVYHSKADGPAHLDPRSVQDMGDTVVGLVRALGHLPRLPPRERAGAGGGGGEGESEGEGEGGGGSSPTRSLFGTQGGRPAFFDLAGLMFVIPQQRLESFCAGLGLIILSLATTLRPLAVAAEALWGIASLIAAITLSVAVAALVVPLLPGGAAHMGWYSSDTWLVALTYAPTALLGLILPSFVRSGLWPSAWHGGGGKDAALVASGVDEMVNNAERAVLVLHTLFMALFSAGRLGSAFLPCAWVAFGLLGHHAVLLPWPVRAAVGLVPPGVLAATTASRVLEFVVPNASKLGSKGAPLVGDSLGDVVVAAIMAALVSTASLGLLPLVRRSNADSIGRAGVGLLGLTMGGIALHVLLPGAWDADHPRRVVLQHTHEVAGGALVLGGEATDPAVVQSTWHVTTVDPAPVDLLRMFAAERFSSAVPAAADAFAVLYPINFLMGGVALGPAPAPLGKAAGVAPIVLLEELRRDEEGARVVAGICVTTPWPMQSVLNVTWPEGGARLEQFWRRGEESRSAVEVKTFPPAPRTFMLKHTSGAGGERWCLDAQFRVEGGASSAVVDVAFHGHTCETHRVAHVADFGELHVDATHAVLPLEEFRASFTLDLLQAPRAQ